MSLILLLVHYLHGLLQLCVPVPHSHLHLHKTATHTYIYTKQPLTPTFTQNSHSQAHMSFNSTIGLTMSFNTRLIGNWFRLIKQLPSSRNKNSTMETPHVAVSRYAPVCQQHTAYLLHTTRGLSTLQFMSRPDGGSATSRSQLPVKRVLNDTLGPNQQLHEMHTCDGCANEGGGGVS
jgi:hypothetical protein